MKKVGIITFHAAENSGAALQCIALQIAIKKIGGDPYIIDYQPRYIREQYQIILNPYKEAKKKNLSGLLFFKSILAYSYQNIRFYRKLSRKRKFEKFRKTYMNLSKKTYFSYTELKNNPPDADVYVAGSDQIWNNQLTNGEYDPAFFLKFGDKTISKYTYAISIGKELSGKDITKICSLFNDIEKISFREKTVYNVFRDMLGDGKVLQCVDPTLLLNQSDWLSFIDTTDSHQPYILVYALEKNQIFLKIVKNIQSTRNITVLDISQCNLNLTEKTKRKMDFSPNEFLYMIRNAEYVLTNSFHCTVFSILFHKQFISVSHSRSKQRTTDLLNATGLQRRSADLDFWEIDEKINWNQVDGKITAFRQQSIDYLRRIIE